MRTFISLVGVLAVAGSFGCGTTVNVIGGEAGSGGEGEGGGVGEGGQGAGVTTTSTSTGIVVPPNPPGCPSSVETYFDCTTADLACSYAEELGCVVTYTCNWMEDCPEPPNGTGGYDGGYGGYGDCYGYGYWVPTTAACAPTAVACADAQSGDTCALPGDYCSVDYEECSYTSAYCGEDHLWQIVENYDECCYDECCYGECECQPYSCPATLPYEGDYCDPCNDSDYCGYQIENECGIVDVYASCNVNTYSWDVYEDPCVGEGGSGAGGDWGGGGWTPDGTGGGF